MEFTRESVFVSTVRAFFKTFAVILGIGMALFVIALGFSSISSTAEIPDKSQITLQPDANWERKLLPTSTPVILRIDITGIIGAGDLKVGKFKQVLIDSRGGILSKDRVKGILLYINSPGGTTRDSAGIYNLIIDYKKRYNVPVFAFVEGLCASGGMYIASAADKILATSNSIIGSVGVRMGPTFNVSEAMEKVGISSLTLTEGKNKDMLNPFRPARPGEADSLKAMIADEYQQFIDVVTSARPQLSKAKLVEDYGANVFISETAQNYGYIDSSGSSYDSALKELVEKVGIDSDKPYQVFKIEPYQSVLRDFAENNKSLLRGKIRHVFPTGPFTDTEMSGQLLYLYSP